MSEDNDTNSLLIDDTVRELNKAAKTVISRGNKPCSFRAIYNDLEAGEIFKAWSCDEMAENSKAYCVFHDKTTVVWDHKIIARFARKVNNIKKMNDENAELCNDKSVKLMCIGYHFPSNFSFALLNCPSKHHKDIKEDQNRRCYNMPIYLCDAEFKGQTEFSYCIFKCSLNLSNAIFRRQVLFRKTLFDGTFYPRNTKFYDNVNFFGAQFENADFHDTLFKDKANFRAAIFTGDDTRFLDVKFEGKANFGGTEEKEEGNYEGTKFYGKVEFSGTTFKEARFTPDVDFQKNTKFRNVIFEDGEKVDFGVLEMKNVSFLNTDISRVKFAENVNWGGSAKKRFTVLEERDLETQFETVKSVKDSPALESIKAIYRNLRENCEYRLRYDDAGQFFIREMELKRNYSKNNKGQIVKTNRVRRNFSLTGFYHLASYGEKFRMPIIFGMSVLLGAFFVSMWQSNSVGITEPNHDSILAINNATERIVTTFLQLRNEHLVLPDFILKALGIVSLGLFAIPLRRKFERKFRH